ncbi:hypothetical protein E3N88_25797 [Mikania micrantha]|uniref:Reverse transcriptase Ty1/copia-type domain-containing protein n=1 Tax=Mikania micrantha TaxID=192012 RepID=A0A5N6N8J2_9ASTR|nr:hypothetical protein E3N88_25797 [Mikania micrantha]
MARYKSVTKNNICAHLDLNTPNARHFIEIITFFRRSRIFTAISTLHVPYISHQQDLWASADIDCEAEPTVILGKVRGQDVVISAEHIRRVRGFQDAPDQLYLLDRYLVRGCFMRCKYEGDLGAGILNKAFMSPQFKYLAHVLIHCLGSRRGGFDDMRETIQCAFVALVLNLPFNFSEMVFSHLKENVTLKGDKKFLMYPRFLQQLIDAQLPNLPKINADILRLEHMNDTTLNRVLPDYIAPISRRWRLEDSDSDSEVEDIIVPDDDIDHDSGAGASGAGGAGASGAGGGSASASVGVSSAVVSSSTVAVDIISVADVSMIDVSGVDASDVSASGGVSMSTAEEENVDIDSLLELDFMTTSTATTSAPGNMTRTLSAEDRIESGDSSDEGGEVGADEAESPDLEDTPDDEFESVWIGGRLMKRKRKRSEAEKEEITDPLFVPEFDISPPPRSSAPATAAVSVAAVQSTSQAGRRKRARFQFQRRSELATAATTTVTSVSSVSVSSLTRSGAILIHTTVAPLTTSIAQAPIFTTAYSGPSISRADTSVPTVSVVDQLNTLNSMVLRLMERNLEQERKSREQDLVIAQLSQRITDQDALLLQAADQRVDLRARSAQQEEQLLKYIDEHNQLALTATGFNERILALKAENARLAEKIEDLKDSTPRLEGTTVHSDDSDLEKDKEEEDDKEEDESDEEKDGSGSGSSGSSSSDDDDDDQAPSTSKIPSKSMQDKKKQAPSQPPPTQTEESAATEEVEVVPVRRQLDETLTMILDAQVEPSKYQEAFKDNNWVEAMQDELLQFKRQNVWTLCPLPAGKYPIGTRWVFRNKTDDRGIVIKK